MHRAAYVHRALLRRVFLYRGPLCSVSSSCGFQILLTKSYLFSGSDSAWPKTGCFIWSSCLLYVQFRPVLLPWWIWSSAQIFFFSLLTNHLQAGWKVTALIWQQLILTVLRSEAVHTTPRFNSMCLDFQLSTEINNRSPNRNSKPKCFIGDELWSCNDTLNELNLP